MASEYYFTIGRRKTAVATLRLFQSEGRTTINQKPVEEVLKTKFLQNKLNIPFSVTSLNPKDFYFTVRVNGGGVSAQADAIKLALARAIIKMDPETKPVLKKAGLTTRDPREVERKKPGLHKARKAEQYSKR